MALDFRVNGIVYERETKRGLPSLIVRAYDKDPFYDDLLGDTTTDSSGRFEIRYTESDFRELFDRQPDIYFRIYDPSGDRLIHSTADSVRWNAGANEYFEVPIPKQKLPPSEEDVFLVDSQGNIRSEFEVSDSLLVNFLNLSPNRSYVVRLLDDRTEEILNASLVSDRNGVIEPTVLWPDIGIGDPEQGGRFAHETIEEALKELAGRTFTVEILDGRDAIRTATLSIARAFDLLRLFPASESGGLQRGLRLGGDEVRVRGQNFPPGSISDVYLVERQFDWRPGDPIVPVRNPDGSEVVTRVQLSADETDFSLTLWPRDQVRTGSYDIIARNVVEHEFRSDERVLRETDIVSDRLMTTLVVRDDVFRVKPVDLGCVNAQREIAGKKLSGSPYFKFTNNFPIGSDVYAALDPGGLMPDAIGKKVRFYVVANKTDAQWSADTSLNDVTGTVSTIITTSGCINGNKKLVWSNPQQPGKYDLIADFGNNSADPSSFIADDSFDAPLDFIDGYFKVGFYLTDDPSVPGGFAVGETSFDDPAVPIPAVGVWGPGGATYGDTPTDTLSLPLRAEVRYPADSNGIEVPVSALQANYPLVVVMHGMHTTADPSYLGYNYLLEHLASHGFIAVSIDCNPINAIVGMQDTRAHAILEHLSLLESKNSGSDLFAGKIDMSNIGIMGHSRGGDGVVQAEIFNQSLGLGFNIKAVVALSPTDFSGTSPSPLVLSTSNFLSIYGSNDGDVWGGTNPSTTYAGTGFRFYDRATVEKAMVFIYGATHNRFNTEWGTEWKVDASSPKVLSTAQHHGLLSGYMTSFMQVHLQGRSEQRDYFKGELRIPQVDTVEVHSQYQTPSRRTLDHFESDPAINQNSLNGSVTPINLDGAPQENLLGALDAKSPHQTRGIKMKWNATTATYESEIPLLPAGLRDLSGYNFLSFRVSQTVGSSANPTDQVQDFYVRLNTAGGGNSRAVRAAYFGKIPYPYTPEYVSSRDGNEGPNTKAAMKTIRIPLHAWTIKCLSAPIVDLMDIESITLEFKSKPTGEILVDDIEFTD